MEPPKQPDPVVRLDQSSPWESRLLWIGAFSLAGGLLGLGHPSSYGAWAPPVGLGVLLLGLGLSMRMLSSSQARVEPTKIHIFSTAADDPLIAHREIEKAEVAAIEVMRTTRDGWISPRTVWEVSALLGSNRRQPLVSWTDAEQAIQAARSSARVLGVEFRDADIEEAPGVALPASVQTAPVETFGVFARTVREALIDPRNPLFGIGFDASEDSVKLYLWKTQLQGFTMLLGSGLFGGMGVLIMGYSFFTAWLESLAEYRPVSGTVYLLGLAVAVMMLRHLRHLGQRNVLILRPGDIAVQSFTAKGEPVLRAIPLQDVEYLLAPKSPSLLVVGADREVVARGGLPRSAYLKVAELIRQMPGWPRRAELKV
ncbi:MAG: hypothetical protein AAB434_06270 [Planctomycetota bacterium]